MIGAIFGVDEVRGLRFGVEVEMEGNLRHISQEALVQNNWTTAHDGSLRNGIEFVNTLPASPINSHKHVDALYKEFNKPNVVIDPSFRCSTHVHMNVSDLSLKDVINIIYAYALLEDVLMTYCGPLRKGNRFCLALREAEGLVDTILAMKGLVGKAEVNARYMINPERQKYSALNIATLRKFGTLEFRGMPGETEVERIHTWLKVLERIYNWGVASSIADTTAFLDEYGAEVFARTVLPHEFLELFPVDVIADSINQSRSIFCEFEF